MWQSVSWVVQKHPSPLVPVYRYTKFIPWNERPVPKVKECPRGRGLPFERMDDCLAGCKCSSLCEKFHAGTLNFPSFGVKRACSGAIT